MNDRQNPEDADELVSDDLGNGEVLHANAEYVLRLYISGTSSHSTRAIINLRRICEENLKGRYNLEVIDIAQFPALAVGEQIVAAPTLIKKSPLPARRFIGDLSETNRVLLGLGLRQAEEKSP